MYKQQTRDTLRPGPKVIKLFSCSTQLSMTFSLLINMKMPTNVGIFYYLQAEKISSSAKVSKNTTIQQLYISSICYLLADKFSRSARFSMKKFYNLGDQTIHTIMQHVTFSRCTDRIVLN